MPSSNRLSQFAIGGCLAAVLALGNPALADEKPSEANTQTQEKTEAQPQPSIVLDTSIFRSIFDDAVKIFSDEKIATEATESRKETREQSDLEAQWVMAIAASVVVFFTLLQICIGTVTLVLLRKTFQETKRTADAAVKAADAGNAAAEATKIAATATERSVEIADITAKRQLRAYISADAQPPITGLSLITVVSPVVV